MQYELDIINKTRNQKYRPYYDSLRRLMAKTLDMHHMKGDYSLSLILVGPVTIHRLNRQYRHIDKVTDVISFAILENEDTYLPKDETIDLGDIFINLQRVKSQAREYGHSEERELSFLFIHGLLHCLGYDHMTKEDEAKMLAMQRKILGKRHEEEI